MGNERQPPDGSLGPTQQSGPTPTDPDAPKDSESYSDPTHLKPPTPMPSPGFARPQLPLPVVPEEHYDVGEEVARGGLGKILRAHDRRLNREVALKVLRVRKRDAETRFLREAMVTAKLQHPAIVPVYEAGVWPDGEPFYAMKLLSGKTLGELIRERKTLAERLALLPEVIAVADAMAYAHQKRVIHRDLKPANVMVGAFGETVVIDWGLAKSLDGSDSQGDAGPRGAPSSVDTGSSGSGSGSSSHETMAGSVMGTLAYMPPEQARGEKVDERADVYSLGAVLYHLLCGKIPFDEVAPSELLRRVMLGPPPDIAQMIAGVPADLAAIVRQSMAARPDDRYPSARELAADLRRFQTGQLVSVRQYSTAEMLRRWVGRHKAAFSMAGVTLAILAVGGTVSFQRVVEERNLAQVAERQADAARAEALRQRDAMVLVEARTALERDPTESLAWLDRHPGTDALSELRSVAADAVSRGTASHVFRAHTGRISGVAFGADSDTLVSTGADGRMFTYDLRTGHSRALAQPPGVLWHMARLPGGERFAVVGNEGQVKLMSTRADPKLLPIEDPPVLVVAASADGAHLAAGTLKGHLWVWDLKTDERRQLPAHPTEVRDLVFSPDGKRLASASYDGSVQIVTLDSGALTKIPRTDEELLSIALSPDGSLLATSGRKGDVHLWDMGGKPAGALQGHQGGITQLAFSPDGRRLASASRDHTVRVWSKPWGTAQVLEHTADVVRLAWSPDSKQLAAGSSDALVRLWNVETGEGQRLYGHRGALSAIVFSEDGKRLASAGQDASVRVWSTQTQGQRLPGVFVRAAISARGTAIAAETPTHEVVPLGEEGTAGAVLGKTSEWRFWGFLDEDAVLGQDAERNVTFWDLRHAERKALGKLDVDVGSAVLSRGWVAAGAYDGTLRLWRLADGAARSYPAHRTYVLAVASAGDGRTLATGGDEGLVKIWDAAGGTSRDLPLLRGPVHRLRFSDDGRLLAAGDLHGEVRVWDVATAKVLVNDRHLSWVRALAFSRDGSMLASSGDDKVIRVHKVATGQTQVLAGPEQSVLDLAFSLDGTLLAVASRDEAVRVYELETGAVRVLRGHRAAVERVVFVPGSESLLSADEKGGVRRWSKDELAPPPVDLHGWVRQATTARIDEQNRASTP